MWSCVYLFVSKKAQCSTAIFSNQVVSFFHLKHAQRYVFFFFLPPTKTFKMMGSMKGYRWMMRDVLFNKNTLSGCEFLFNPITITIAPLVLPSCSAVRVWTTARHASSDHRRHLPDRSLTSGHLPALRPWNTHTHTDTDTHTHTKTDH